MTRVADLRDRKDNPCLGIFAEGDRSIRLAAENGIETDWLTYWHEWVHLVLFDAGVRIDKDDAERVCDAIALARTRELQGRLGRICRVG